VTSTGKYLTANSYTNPELVLGAPWWGGGTYGIVTSATYRTHPSLPLTAVFKPTQPTAVKLLAEFIRIQPSLSDAGFSGYALIGPNDLIWFYIALNVTQAQANKTVDPFFAFASNLTSEGLNISTAFTVPYPSFYSWYKFLYSPPDRDTGMISEIQYCITADQL
jgi:hypothetical protein